MHDTAAHLVDRVLPRVPMRQWVVTFPRRERWHLAHDPALASEALRLCMRSVFGWQRALARRRGIVLGAPARSQSARSGAIAFVQRFDSSLALDWHVHALVPDGVFVRPPSAEDREARPRFVRLPPPTDADVGALLARIAARIDKLLRRRGRLEAEQPADGDDVQAELELRASRPLSSGRFEPPPLPPLCARMEGYSLHAGIAIHENDRQGLERLARYCARPALSQQRLSREADGRVRYRMKRTFSDGRSEVLLSGQDFLIRLCALIPPPRVHVVRYFGAFAPRARGRRALVGRSGDASGSSRAAATVEDPRPAVASAPPVASTDALGDPPVAAARPRRLDWATLLQRVHAIDVFACRRCGGPTRVIAVITDTDIAERILRHLGLPPTPAARPRPPPSAHRLAADPTVEDPWVDARPSYDL
jgi:hypothetical protein